MASDTNQPTGGAAAEGRSEPQETESEMNQQSAAPLTCPECAAQGVIKTFRDKRGLATHRRILHGVPGSSRAVIALRKHQQELKRKVGRPKGSTSAVTASRLHHPTKKALPSAPEFSPGLLGYTAAKLESLAEQIAHENGLPEKEFARQAMATFTALVQF